MSCPFCKSNDIVLLSGRIWECNTCKKRFSNLHIPRGKKW